MLRQGRGYREVARGDHAQPQPPGLRTDLAVVVRRQTGGTDHHTHAVLQRGQRARLYRIWFGVIDQHVGPRWEYLLKRSRYRNANRGPAQRLAYIPPRALARDRPGQLEFVRLQNVARHRAPRPSRRPGNT